MKTSRADNLSFEELQKHFNMPMTEAAKQVGVCLTFFKKICRTHGISRWPFRKLKSLQNQISDLESRLQENPNTCESQLKRRLEELHEINAQAVHQPEMLAPRSSSGPGSVEYLALVSVEESQRSDDEAEGPCSSETPTLTDDTSVHYSCSRRAQQATYDELTRCFHLPMTQAAKQFGVSLTLFKKVCRKNGITRWPHRKLKSLKSKIGDLQSRLHSSQGSRENELRRRLEELRHLDCDQKVHSLEDAASSTQSYEEGHSAVPAAADQEEAGAMCLAMLSSRIQGEVSEEGSSGSDVTTIESIASVASAATQYSFAALTTAVSSSIECC